MYMIKTYYIVHNYIRELYIGYNKLQNKAISKQE